MFNLFVVGLRSSFAGLLCAVVLSASAFAETKASPALWKVEGKDATVYLLGSYHLLPAGLDWISPEIEEAFAASDVLVTEADSSDEAAMVALVQKHGLNPAGVTLRSLLTEEQAAKVDNAFGGLGLTVETGAPFQPWFLALQAGVVATMRLGFDPQMGVEQVLHRKAEAAGMSADYLETAEAGLVSFSSHATEIQVEMLLAGAEDMAGLEEQMTATLNAWVSGDIDQVGDLLNQSLSKTPEVFEAAIIQRNRNWIPVIEGMLADERTYFIAAGAGHMAGDQSVIALLKAKGHKVERINR